MDRAALPDGSRRMAPSTRQPRRPTRRRQGRSATAASRLSVLAPLYLLVFLSLHIWFALFVVANRTRRRSSRLWQRLRGDLRAFDHELLFELTGRQLRCQIDGASNSEGQVDVQVVKATSGSGTAPEVKVPRHLAVVFADRSDSLATTAYKAILSRALSTLHLAEKVEERRLIERTAELVEDTRRLVRWAALLGVDQLSVYDDKGLLKQYYQRQTGAKQGQAWTGDKATPSLSGGTQARQEALSASSESGFSQASSDFDHVAERSLGSSATSLSPPEEGSSANGKLPVKSVRTQRPARSNTCAGPPASSYRITVELCISGEHDVSSDAQMARRKASIKWRKINALQDRHSATPLNLTLNVLGPEDSKAELARVATDLRELVREQTEDEMRVDGSHSSCDAVAERKSRRQMQGLLLDRINAKKVDSALAERGYMSEPDLLMIKGGPRRTISLHGFPPWAVRLSEIYHCSAVEAHERLKAEDLMNALLQYSGSTQRYGR